MNEKIKIHFVLEGNEEESLFKIVENYGIGDNLEVSYINSGGGGNVPYYFQDAIQSGNYDLVYCVYDVDFKSEEKKGMYQRIVNGLFRVLGSKKEVDRVSLCTNPDILLILLSGYVDDINELSTIQSDKSSNTDLINKCCSKPIKKKKYDASSWQLELIESDYLYTKKASYDKVLDKINVINIEYKTNSIGSNILQVLKALFENDVDYFMKIIKENEKLNI